MFKIRLIKKEDNPAIKELIQTVLAEHGATGGGFAGSDPELATMYEFYSEPRRMYFILEDNNHIVGGAGISTLAGAAVDVCELQKMYFSKEARGKGYGSQMINHCLKGAIEQGFKTCYLETLTNMESAQTLYKKVGFKQIDAPMGNTGHFGCNSFFSLELSSAKLT